MSLKLKNIIIDKLLDRIDKAFEYLKTYTVPRTIEEADYRSNDIMNPLCLLYEYLEENVISINEYANISIVMELFGYLAELRALTFAQTYPDTIISEKCIMETIEGICSELEKLRQELERYKKEK